MAYRRSISWLFYVSDVSDSSRMLNSPENSWSDAYCSLRHLDFSWTGIFCKLIYLMFRSSRSCQSRWWCSGGYEALKVKIDREKGLQPAQSIQAICRIKCASSNGINQRQRRRTVWHRLYGSIFHIFIEWFMNVRSTHQALLRDHELYLNLQPTNDDLWTHGFATRRVFMQIKCLYTW